MNSKRKIIKLAARFCFYCWFVLWTILSFIVFPFSPEDDSDFSYEYSKASLFTPGLNYSLYNVVEENIKLNFSDDHPGNFSHTGKLKGSFTSQNHNTSRFIHFIQSFEFHTIITSVLKKDNSRPPPHI